MHFKFQNNESNYDGIRESIADQMKEYSEKGISFTVAGWCKPSGKDEDCIWTPKISIAFVVPSKMISTSKYSGRKD